MLPYLCRASSGSAGLLPASSRPVKVHSAGRSFKLPSCGCCTSFVCTTTRAPLGLSTRTGCLHSAAGCSSVPGLRLTEQSKTAGMGRAGNIPPMLDGAFLPPPKVPAAFPGHLSQWWMFKLDFRNREVCKRHNSSSWGLACYITGDYPVPTHICNDNICLLA